MRSKTPPHIYGNVVDDQFVADNNLVQVVEPDVELSSSDEEFELDSNPPDRIDSKLTFSKHEETVNCVALNPEGTLAVSGDEGGKVFVWNVENGDVVHEITGHTDSVTAVGFNRDGTNLATCDMAGYIQVFKVSQQYKLIWTFKGQSLCWMKWHVLTRILMAGMKSGDIYVWHVPQGDCTILNGFGEKCDAATVTNNGRKLAAGYGNGHFKIWDISTGRTIMDSPPDELEFGHSDNISCVACDRRGQLFVTGSADRLSLIFNLQGVIGTLDPEDGEVLSVLVDCPDTEEKLVVTATVNGVVDIWDVEEQDTRFRYEDVTAKAITKILWGKNCTLIGAASNYIKIWDVTNGDLKYVMYDHYEPITDVAYHKEKGIIVSSSTDETCKVFQISEM